MMALAVVAQLPNSEHYDFKPDDVKHFEINASLAHKENPLTTNDALNKIQKIYSSVKKLEKIEPMEQLFRGPIHVKLFP